MEKILVQSDRVRSARIAECEKTPELSFVGSKQELCNGIVNEKEIVGAVIEIEQIDEKIKEFLVSLHRHFPLLKIGVISPVEIGGENIEWLDMEAIDAEVDGRNGTLCSFLTGPFQKNKREANRYDWILHGYIGGEIREASKYRIRSLGAGGAFLESDGGGPEPGTVNTLRITFQNFQLFTECEILERRQSSSNLPAGFGVRFLNLQPKTSELIHRIVNDAVFQVLIEPEIEPEVPSLDEDELTIDLMAL